MAEENVNADTSKGDNAHADLEGMDESALKEAVITERTAKAEMEGNNKQLFERAKTAEGFKKQEDGSWVKTEKVEVKKKSEKKEPEAKKEEKKSDELDYGQKAYLNTKEIKESEHGFIEDQLAESGLELNEMLENGYFKAKLQEFRDKAAVDSSSDIKQGRGAQESAKSKAEYWVEKGELPPNTAENFELRQEVVNLRTAREKGGHSQFTPHGVIESGLA